LNAIEPMCALLKMPGSHPPVIIYIDPGEPGLMVWHVKHRYQRGPQFE